MFLPPPSNSSVDQAGAQGESYGAVVLAADERSADALRGALRTLRFSGWIAPAADGWQVVLGDPGAGVVAAGRRGIIEVGAVLAASHPAVMAIRVRRDRQLAIVAWRSGEEVGRYCSDPSQEPGDDDDVVPDPIGAEHAAEFAALCRRDEVAEDLEELLEEELDTESVFESERLATALRMLGLPGWLVAVGALPRDIPTGPRAKNLTRLRVGVPGAAGVFRSRFVAPVRRRRTPPPVILDPPRSDMSGIEPWML